MSTEEIKKETTAQAKADEKSKYDPKELATIFDSIIFEGSYTESVKIKGRLDVTFKSRSAGEVSAISKELDTKSFNLLATLQEQRAILNLSYSLVGYNGRDLSGQKPEDRKSFVEKLPASIVASLSEALLKFDLKVDEACKEGEENF